MTSGTGLKDDPWDLLTPSGGSAFQAWRDESLDPPALVVQVGKTQPIHVPTVPLKVATAP